MGNLSLDHVGFMLWDLDAGVERWEKLGFKLSRPLSDPRIRRKIQSSAHRTAHFVDLRSADEVDEQVRSWLAESWLDSTG